MCFCLSFLFVCRSTRFVLNYSRLAARLKARQKVKVKKNKKCENHSWRVFLSEVTSFTNYIKLNQNDPQSIARILPAIAAMCIFCIFVFFEIFVPFLDNLQLLTAACVWWLSNVLWFNDGLTDSCGSREASLVSWQRAARNWWCCWRCYWQRIRWPAPSLTTRWHRAHCHVPATVRLLLTV